jgi:hypothetical protein
MEPFSDRIITAPVAEFCILSGLGHTKVYELIGSGELESIKIGKRRLIVLASYRRLINRQRDPSAERSAVSPPTSRRRPRGAISTPIPTNRSGPSDRARRLLTPAE